MSNVTETIISDHFVSIAPLSICESKLIEAAQKAKFNPIAEKNVLKLSQGLADIYREKALGIISSTAEKLEDKTPKLAEQVRQIAQSIPSANPA